MLVMRPGSGSPPRQLRLIRIAHGRCPCGRRVWPAAFGPSAATRQPAASGGSSGCGRSTFSFPFRLPGSDRPFVRRPGAVCQQRPWEVSLTSTRSSTLARRYWPWSNDCCFASPTTAPDPMRQL